MANIQKATRFATEQAAKEAFKLTKVKGPYEPGTEAYDVWLKAYNHFWLEEFHRDDTSSP